MGVSWRQRWDRLPVAARCALVIIALGFAEGLRSHIADLVRGGLGVYSPFGSVAVQAFFLSLVIVDPIVIVLVVSARAAGVWLAVVVMVADFAVNVSVSWPRVREDWWWLVLPTGALPLTFFTVFVVATATALARRLTRGHLE